ncbi:type II toxin-antitoxin system RelE/ParE family toxin [Dickeya chrysanthemi]|uniref:type II toxin-antitoxin system RelE/ParE family toxin n=1 Tax=Dickeya chrysanthemi TaxID=556 RepID=UPI0030159710
MDYQVVYATQAQEQLAGLYDYIARAATPNTALGYTEGLVDYCESLSQFPHRGSQRDDILPGLRVTNYRKRTIVAFVVDEVSMVVSVVGIWHGGQDYERELLSAEND